MVIPSIESLPSLSAPIRVTGDLCPQAVFRRRRNTGPRLQQWNFTSPWCEGDHFHCPFILLPDLFPEALRLLDQAIARDPRYGPALAWAAVCCYRLLQDDRSADPRAARAQGVDYARRALEVAGDDPFILANAADALSYFG